MSVASPEPAVDIFEHGINRLAMSRNGRFIACSDVDMNVLVSDGEMHVYSRNFSSTSQKTKPLDRIRGLEFSPSGDALYIAAGDHVWAIGLPNGVVKWEYVAPRSFGFLIISPTSIDVSDAGDIVAAFDNGSVVVWNSSGMPKAKWQDNDSPRMLGFGVGGRRIVGVTGGKLCAWNVEHPRKKARVLLKERVHAFAVHRSLDLVATRTLHEITIWDLMDNSVVRTISVKPGLPILAFHPTEKWIAFGEGSVVKVCDIDGELLHKVSLDVGSALSLAFKPSGEDLLIGCTQQRILRIPVGSDRDSFILSS